MTQQKSECRCIILAAGLGTRMKSRWPKVLHAIACKPLLGHVLDATRAIGADRIGVVLGEESESDPVIADAIQTLVDGCETFIQTERLGTAHAALAAARMLAPFEGDLLILFGDNPLIRPETFTALRESRKEGGAAIALLAMRPEDPAQYGRIVTDADGAVSKIVEYADASEAERAITLCNAGIMAIDGQYAKALLEQIGNANAKGEYYLTDIVGLAVAAEYKVVVCEAPEEDVMGVNSRVELAEAESKMQKRLRLAAMENGVTLVAPDTVFFADDTQLGQDVVIEPHVVFGPGAVIGDGVTIRGFSHIEAAKIAAGATIGPYARLRPGSDIGEGARIGNFVEIKKSTIGPGAKVSHLSYIGDASIGAASNIGAGTITCNYDGYDKHRTSIGTDVFVGSNTALVAPVEIGDSAMIGAGSTITKDVPEDALAVARGRQTVIHKGASSFRRKRDKSKK